MTVRGVHLPGDHDRPISVVEVLCVIGALLLVLVVGLFALPSYGVSTDEVAQRLTGRASLFYVTETFGWKFAGRRPVDVPALDDHVDRDYGVAFELPAEALVAAMGLQETRDIFLLRHLLTFLSYLGAVVALYISVRLRHRDWRFAAVAALLLLASPRIWADSFYNSKDIVFMAAFAVASLASIEMLRRRTLASGLIAGVALGVAVDVRIMAVLIPAAVVALGFVSMAKERDSARSLAMVLATYVAAAALVTVALWPWLWADPAGRIVEAFASMSKFRWSGVNLYFGQLLNMSELPWHYVPVWIGITTPILYSVLALTGAVKAIYTMVRARLQLWRSDDEMRDLWYLAMALGPVLAVIVLGSTLYDGWRQLYFVYPAMLYLAALGLRSVLDALEGQRWGRWVAAGVVAAAVLWSTGLMVLRHPYSNAYFNVLAGENLKERWPVDYWGVTFDEATRAILASDPSPQVPIWGDSSNATINGQWMLSQSDQDRAVAVVDRRQAAYIINNYNNAFSNPVFANPDYSNFELMKVISVGDEPICSIYRRVR